MSSNSISSSTANLVNTSSCIAGSISILASLLTIRLVLLMKRNGLLLVVLSLAITQCAVDIGHIIIPPIPAINYNHKVCQLKGFMLIFGNLSGALWTNVLSLSVFYIVLLGRSFEISKYYYMYFLFCCGLPLLFSIIVVSANYLHNSTEPTASCSLTESAIMGWSVLYDDDHNDDALTLKNKIAATQTYNILHLMSLSFNTIVSLAVFIRISMYSNFTEMSVMSSIARISIFSGNSLTSMINGNNMSRRQLAIRTIAFRHMLYPIAQTIAEIFRIADAATGNRNLFLMFSDEIYDGILGTIYFIIFLCMQPNARKYLMNDINLIVSCKVAYKSSNTVPLLDVNDNSRIQDMSEEALMEQINMDDNTDNNTINCDSNRSSSVAL